MTDKAVHPNENQAVAVGAVAPDFSLENWDGTVHNLTVGRASAPLVLVFYRGDW